MPSYARAATKETSFCYFDHINSESLRFDRFRLQAMKIVNTLRVATFALLVMATLCQGVAAQENPSSPANTSAENVQPNASQTPQSGSGSSESETAIPPSPTAESSKTFNDRVLEIAWIKKIDDFFRDYLVTPIGIVLFFPVGTEKHNIPFVVGWLLVAGIFLTLRMGFINFRAFRHAIDLVRGKYDDPSETGEVSHFQALSSALSATVGLGNIAGVALAIGLGGPGATFWMIVVGLIGMTSKFTECSLGMMFRRVSADGTVLGGPMRYLHVGLAERGLGSIGLVLSTLFAFLCIGASFGGGNAYQIGQSLGVLQQSSELAFLRDMPWVYGIVMAIAVGVVIIGGIKSIANVAEKIVPFMCGAYILACGYIIITHISAVPAAFATIILEAFSPRATIAGGFIGVLVWGTQRAVFSNEAGVGSAAIAHSAAKTDEPISEGIVALMEPFIDTVVVCTCTALAIVITGVYLTPEGQAFAAAKNGAAITRLAFQTGGFEWFQYILFMTVILFAYSTCISWSYYGERCFAQLFGDGSSLIYKILFLIFTVLGSIISHGNILDFSDSMILAMSIPNLIGVYILSGRVRRELDIYWSRYQRGELEPAVTYKK